MPSTGLGWRGRNGLFTLVNSICILNNFFLVFMRFFFDFMTDQLIMLLQRLLPCFNMIYFLVFTLLWFVMVVLVLVMLILLWLWLLLLDLGCILDDLNFFRLRVTGRLLDFLLGLNMIWFFFLDWLVMVNLVIFLLFVSMSFYLLVLFFFMNNFLSNSDIFVRHWLSHSLLTMMMLFMFLFFLLILRKLFSTHRLRNSFNAMYNFLIFLNSMSFLLLLRLLLLMFFMIFLGHYLLLFPLLMILLFLLWRIIEQGVWLLDYFLALQLNLLRCYGLLSERYFDLLRLDFMLRLGIFMVNLLLMSRLFFDLCFMMTFLVFLLHFLLCFFTIFHRFLRRFISESRNLLLRLHIHLPWLPFIGQVALSTGLRIGRIRVYGFFIVRMLGHC